jgi:hypothetical protein
MKVYGGVGVQINIFLTAVAGGKWPPSSPGRFNPGEICPVNTGCEVG